MDRKAGRLTLHHTVKRTEKNPLLSLERKLQYEVISVFRFDDLPNMAGFFQWYDSNTVYETICL